MHALFARAAHPAPAAPATWDCPGQPRARPPAHPRSTPPPPQELAPGTEQKVWVQSQTTFALLHKEEDGTFDVRVAKQKIWVDGVSYELQVRGLREA